MKQLTIALVALLLYSSAFTQSDDTTQYTYYRYVYGNRTDRLWGNLVVRIPKDTIWSKEGVARKDSILYVGDGIRWRAVGAGPRYDSTIMATLYRLDTAKANLRATLAAKPPPDFTDSYVGDGTKQRDTTVAVSGGCGPVTIKYLYYKLPQYIGFGLRVNSFWTSIVHGDNGYCLFRVGYYEWNSTTGELFLLDWGDAPGFGIQFTMEPY